MFFVVVMFLVANKHEFKEFYRGNSKWATRKFKILHHMDEGSGTFKTGKTQKCEVKLGAPKSPKSHFKKQNTIFQEGMTEYKTAVS